MQKKRMMKRIVPLCLTAAIAVGATHIVDQATLNGGLSTFAGLFGDVNSDGSVTIADVLAVVEYILNDGYTTGIFNYQAANVDTSDYNITIADAVKILEIILKGGPQHE